MTSLPENTRVVKKRLADGTVKTYHYPKERKKKARGYEPNTMAALIMAYMRSPEWLAKKPATHTNYRIYLRFLDGFLHTKVADLKRRNVLAVRDAIAAQRGHGAANVFLRVTSTILTWAVDRGWIEYSPVTRVKAIPGGHLTAWTAKQADHAIAHLPEPLRRVVILARYTGQRRGDLTALDWLAYDGSTIRLRQQKARAGSEPTALVIPVHPVLRAELNAWKASATSTRILTTDHGLPWRGEHLSRMMAVWLPRIGLPAGLNVHGLRKLAAAELAESGCSANEIASVTGHRTLAMVQLYTRSADQERLAEAAIVRLQTKPRQTAQTKKLKG